MDEVLRRAAAYLSYAMAMPAGSPAVIAATTWRSCSASPRACEVRTTTWPCSIRQACSTKDSIPPIRGPKSLLMINVGDTPTLAPGAADPVGSTGLTRGRCGSGRP